MSERSLAQRFDDSMSSLSSADRMKLAKFILGRDELSDAEFILEDDCSISDDLAFWDG